MNLKKIRIKRNMTQHDVAAHLGYTDSAYSHYEQGTRQPSVECLIKMADLFGVTLDYLLGRTNTEGFTLSHKECILVTAARNADERAFDDALRILRSHALAKRGIHNLVD